MDSHKALGRSLRRVPLRWAASSLLGSLLLTGCQQEIRPTTASAPSVVSAICGPAGTEVRANAGFTLTYRGRDEGDPEVCRVGAAALPFGLPAFVVLQGGGRVEPDAAARAALRELVPFAPGRTATYLLQGPVGSWRDTWRIVEARQVTVPAGTFDVWVVEGVREGVGQFNWRTDATLYIERATGVMVKREIRALRGSPLFAPSFEAIEVIRPAAARPS